METFRLLMSILGLGLMATVVALGLWVTDWGLESTKVIGAFASAMLFLSAWPVVVILGIVGVVFAVDRLFKRRKP
jgi:hypothetical protein